MDHDVRAVRLWELLVVLVPVDTTIAGLVTGRVDVVHGEARPHQGLESFDDRWV